MDTKTLVVGQDVYMSCGYYVCKGEVVKVTPEGAVVRHKDQSNTGELLRFDSNGKGWYIDDTSDCPGPWYIDDMPFAERTALLEQNRKLRDAEREALFEKGRKLRDGNQPPDE